jgi:hypothetical protein
MCRTERRRHHGVKPSWHATQPRAPVPDRPVPSRRNCRSGEITVRPGQARSRGSRDHGQAGQASLRGPKPEGACQPAYGRPEDRELRSAERHGPLPSPRRSQNRGNGLSPPISAHSELPSKYICSTGRPACFGAQPGQITPVVAQNSAVTCRYVMPSGRNRASAVQRGMEAATRQARPPHAAKSKKICRSAWRRLRCSVNVQRCYPVASASQIGPADRNDGRRVPVASSRAAGSRGPRFLG